MPRSCRSADAPIPPGRGPPEPYPGAVKEFWVYTAARIGLFVAALAVCGGGWVLLGGSDGAGSFLVPFVLAVVLSAVGSYYLLRGPRERLAAVVDRRARAASERFEQVRAKEDLD